VACSEIGMAATLWKGHLSFGLVSIPIRLVRAARAEKIHMHNLERQTSTRVRRVFVPAVAEETTAAPDVASPARTLTVAPPFSMRQAPAPISDHDLVRGFEYEKDKYVAFEPGELEKIAPRNSTTMEILEFVKFDEVDPVYLETSYYVAPDKGGEKPYALLFEALRKTGKSAIAEFVMYRRDQTVLLRAGAHGIVAHTLFHNDEVRESEEFHADAGLVKPGETELAIKLVEALEASFEPAKFKDKYREKLKEAIAQKIGSGAVTEAPVGGKAAPVVDIMAALKASLNNTRKPVGRESAPAAPAAKKRKSGGRG